VHDWLSKLQTDLAWIYSGTGSGMSCSLAVLLGALSLGDTGAGTLRVKLPAMIQALQHAIVCNSALRERRKPEQRRGL